MPEACNVKPGYLLDGMKVACVGDAAKNGAGDWNLSSFRELEDVAEGKA